MWYKYLNRNYDQVRLFRNANLKYNQDDLGMTKHRAISKNKDLLFRMGRHEGSIRGYNFFFMFGCVLSLLYFKKNYYDPAYTAPKAAAAKQKEIEGDKLARQKLFYNNLGIPTKPSRSIEQIFLFLGSSEAINKTINFITYALDINVDQIAGLDSASTENDERMIELLTESKKRKGGH